MNFTELSLLSEDTNRLKIVLNEIPHQVGCYLMRDLTNRVLYIGKSKNLRNRVRSYFNQKERLTPRIKLMVHQIANIEIILTDTETEALTLESNLIKEQQPYFNVLLKDDKKYPYLCITWSEEYPRIYITRRRRERNLKDKYYGPYVDVTMLRSTLAFVKRTFKLRQRKIPLYKDRPCLNYSIGMCPGVCQEKISPADYKKTLKDVEMIFQGRSEELNKLLKRQMQKYSQRQEYESAARIRDQLKNIDLIVSQQKMIDPDSSISRDVIALAINSKIASIQIFQMRSGKLVNRLGYITNTTKENKHFAIQRIIEEHYSSADKIEIPSEILVEKELPQNKLISNWLSELVNRKVSIIQPKISKNKRFIELVKKNASFELKRIEKGNEKNEIALDEVADLLELNARPHRIEGYDISHIQGSDVVASQVVFINATPAKQHYRKYKIKSRSIHSGHSDDFMSLREVVLRRFRRWARIKAEGGDIHEIIKTKTSKLDISGLNDWPDLILIDGGKGQLNSVLEALRELDLIEEVSICSLAKRNEEIYLPGLNEPLLSDRDKSGHSLLRRVRDEAHRFAVDFHRQKRGARMTRSRLSDIPGIGPKRIRDLLNHFQSIDAIRISTIEDISNVQGLGEKAAKNIWEYFHPEESM